MPLQPVALADTYRNISLKQNSNDPSFATLTANAVTDTLTLIAGPGITFSSDTDTITILNDFGDENAVVSIKGIQIDGILIDTNVIQMTDSNANLEIRANGSGSVYVNDSLIVQDNVTVKNNLTVDNTLQTQTLNVTGQSTFQGPIIAQNNVTVAGSLTLTGDINGGPLRTDDIQIVGNRIETTVSNSNLELNTVGSGSIELLANTNITGNLVLNSQLTLTTNSISTTSGGSDLTLTANGVGRVIVETFAFSGNNLDTTDSSGISITPSVTFESDIIAQNGIHTQGHIVPDTDLAYKLGDPSSRFTTAYIDRLVTLTDVEVQFGGTGVGTFTTNGVLFGNSTSPLQVTAASNPGSNATTSYGILTTDGSNVPLWTDVIDGGSY
jgi:cytoskeletal protein CcmA (bactofilin family)